MTMKCGHCKNYRKFGYATWVCGLTYREACFFGSCDKFEKKEEVRSGLPEKTETTKSTKTTKTMNNESVTKCNDDKKGHEDKNVTVSQNTAATEKGPRMKVCNVCGRELPIEQFDKQYKSADGHFKSCKECRKKKIAAGMKRHYDGIASRIEAEAEQIFKTEKAVAPEKKQGWAEYKVTPEEKKDEIIGNQPVSDQQLVDELRRRGYEVVCTKIISL